MDWKNCVSPINRHERPAWHFVRVVKRFRFTGGIFHMTAQRQSTYQTTAKRAIECAETATAVHHLFAAQAERTPQATALAFNHQSLNYRELNRRADAFAEKLIRLGVGPDSLVALSSERSLEQIIAMLAVLKAGGAYVPVDPAYPDDRLAAILEDARPQALLTHQHLMPRLSSFAGAA
jgi:non-ribosomal peptide synthetase component F